MPLAKQTTASEGARCYKCDGPVTWARMKDGRRWKTVAIEKCPDGEGNMAIFPVLFADTNSAPIVEEVVNGTSFRLHDARCSGPETLKRWVRDSNARRIGRSLK